ncbi:exonuclease domain-containing protein [Aquimarina sp. W85]|uniref:exonuclease domain-containing protein n=1 Tax=Aquimarina rhodophyticola TaxID=3342246 RepID=UPI00366C33A1
MYAILDIETTGGKYNEEGITEIAIYKFDGQEVVDQFISLINPEKEIQPFVVNLTGINNEMLRNAPKFYEIAKRIVEITQDCILVAHNASFDYRILRTEFGRLGFEYERKSLCTVELSQELIPDQPSYSLGKLVRSLGIPLSDRHRANGDALATIKLFKLLLAKDIEKTIITEAIRTETKKQVGGKLLEILNGIPATTGVYYIHNKAGSIIYIGKSKNLKNRLNQHFTGENKKSKKIQDEVEHVTFEITGSELIALLKEAQEIKTLKPIYNRFTRKPKFDHGLYQLADQNGYISLTMNPLIKEKEAITTFTNRQQATSYMRRWTEEFELCARYMGLEKGKESCSYFDNDKCLGACIAKENPEVYNQRAKKLIAQHSFASSNMIIIDRGRTIDEQSAILIENGKLKGVGFFNLNHQVHNIDILKTLITPIPHDQNMQHIIQSYMRKHKRLKIIKPTYNV